MSTLYNKIRTRHTTSLNTKIKDFLPIIGNEIPNKLFTNFSVEDTAFLACSGTGAFDYIKAFKAKACYKMTAATGAGTTLTYTPVSAIDFTSLGSETNNYANISKYGLGGNAQDNLYFTFMWNAVGDGTTSIKVYNGTKTATLTTAIAHTTPGWQNIWYKSNLALNNTIWTYAAGFADADWANITKVEITTIASSGTAVIYFHGLWAALPQYQLADQATMTLADAYYPNVAASVIYVSHLFGDDANAGTAYNAPKKTIEAGITAALSGNKDYVCIIDSATYKPIDEANYTAGINATLTRDITIIAEYLETPTISAEAGLFDATRTGARDYYRTAFYENIGGAGTKRTVGTGGTYATIALAYAAASAGDCIEILDSAVYDETLTIAKDITIQAAPLQKPTWKYTGGNTTITSTGDYAINLFGIIFQGNSSNAETRITINNATATKSTRIVDCSFKNIGGTNNAGATYAVSIIGKFLIENTIVSDFGLNIDATNPTTAFVLTFKENSIMLNNIWLEANTGYQYIYAKIADTASKKIDIIGGLINMPFNANAFDFSYSAASSKIAFYLNYFYNSNLVVRAIQATSILVLSSNYFNNFDAIYVTGGSQSNHVQRIYGNIYEDCPQQAVWMVGTYYSIKNLYINTEVFYQAVNAASWTHTIEHNIYYDCDVITSSYPGSAPFITTNFDYCIFLNNSLENRPQSSFLTSVFGIRYALYYGNTLSVNPPTITSSVAEDPLFLSPENNVFAWDVTSPINNNDYTYAWHTNILAFITSVGAGWRLSLKYLNIKGTINTRVAKTSTGYMTMQYCAFTDFCQGLRCETAILTAQNNTIATNDGVAIDVNSSTVATTSVVKNNIIADCYVGVFLRSGCDLQYNTIVDNDYGVYGVFEGFYALEQYIKDYMTIKNNILFGNAIYDFAYDKLTDYNIIGSRLYPLTAGDNDSNENPQLDADYYPATVYTGFKKNSPAYLTASDSGKHKGARNEQHLKATFAYTAYTFTDNPINFTQEIEPVNAQSTMSVAGVYEGIVDAFVAAFYMEWTEDTISDATQKAAIEAIKKTTWIVGLSFDAGSTWNYYKVELDGVLSTKQPVYILQEVPYGSYNLRVREIPNFVITDYEINSL